MNNKKYIIIALVVILVGGVVAIFLYKNKTKNIVSNTVPFGSVSIVNKPEATTTAIEDKKIESALNVLNVALEKTKQTDQDLDGLSDEEEKKLGTNPSNPDTDSDGLLDSDEVNIFHTNPLKADTDTDGFKDGAEVRSGYNPLGSGKLK